MAVNSKKRILLVGNSQGTAAELDGELLWSNYPLLIEDAMPDIDCRYWMMSDLSVATIDSLFREIVMQHRPDTVILQCGIIETALRILPKNLRELLRILPGGRLLTGVIYKNQRSWRRILNFIGIHFIEIDKAAFETHLCNIHEKCLSHRIKLTMLRIPLISEQCDQGILPQNNTIIKEYNEIIEEVCERRHITLLDPFENNNDESRNSLYLKDSVHFSEKGHKLIASNLMNFLKKYLSESK